MCREASNFLSLPAWGDFFAGPGTRSGLGTGHSACGAGLGLALFGRKQGFELSYDYNLLFFCRSWNSE